MESIMHIKDGIEPDDLISRIDKEKLNSINSLIYSSMHHTIIVVLLCVSHSAGYPGHSGINGLSFGPLKSLCNNIFT